MFTPDQYELIDFGDGRRLERFAGRRIDRPAPAVERIARTRPGAWQGADARFERTGAESGEWVGGDGTRQGDSPIFAEGARQGDSPIFAAGARQGDSPETRQGDSPIFAAQKLGQSPAAQKLGQSPAAQKLGQSPVWRVRHGQVVFELKPSPAGQVGVFPEQAANWDWIDQRVRAAGGPLRILNLFAYTGGSTLAAAAAGAEVVHVDAAANTVAWARRNAELSALSDRPVRWIAEDAVKFAKRELKRGNRYDAVILDPPSYGHGPRGEVWRLSKHLGRLLALAGELTAGRRRFLLLTCHTPGFDPPKLRAMLQRALGDSDPGAVDAGQLALVAADGRRMPSGVFLRWEARP